MNQGIVFNIQKFSIHDGPGIRTTVFLKGCPLRCRWCANPESQYKHIQVLHDDSKCILCESCIQNCSQHALSIQNQSISIDNHLCIGCGNCIKSCTQHALSLEGEYREVNDILRICLQDQAFYEESNGGVTISGGEGMIQPDFVKELVDVLHEHNIHTAIEATGYVPATTFRELATKFDLLLFDVKHYDNEQHKKGTGVGNQRILDNLHWAITHNIPLLPRIPIIPNFNAQQEDAKGFVSLLKKIHIQEVQLLPFHQFGEKKYELLHREYDYHHVKALYKEDLKAYQQIFLDAGIHCYF